MEEASSMRS